MGSAHSQLCEFEEGKFGKKWTWQMINTLKELDREESRETSGSQARMSCGRSLVTVCSHSSFMQKSLYAITVIVRSLSLL